MKTPSNDLYQLIHALTPAERALFKKTIAKKQVSGERAYRNLFQLAEKKKEINEPAIIKALGYEKKKATFSALKNYLYNEIMDVLIRAGNKTSPAMQSLQQIQQLDILAEKGLPEQYMKWWRKVYKDAVKQEHFQLRFMLKEQLHGLKMNFIIKTNHTQLKIMIDEDEQFAEEYNQLQKIKNLYLHIQLYNKQSQIRLRPSETASIKTLLLHPVLAKLPANSSFHFRYYFNMSTALLHYLTHDYQQAYKALDTLKPDLIRHKTILELNPHLGIEFINVFYLVSFLCLRYETFFQFLDHPVNQFRQSEHHTAYIAAFRANSRLRFYMTNGYYTEAGRHLAETEKSITRHLAWMPLEVKQQLMGSVSVSYFILGNYAEALYYNKECMKTFHDNPREDIQRYTYAIGILVAYEMNNTRLLLNECDNAYQFFYRKKIMTAFEETLISFFRKIIRVQGRKNRKEKFTELRTKLGIIRKDPIMAQVFRYFNFYGWAESREMGITYMEYVQQNRKSRT
jgi:hypothetical protein